MKLVVRFPKESGQKPVYVSVTDVTCSGTGCFGRLEKRRSAGNGTLLTRKRG
ncbi:colicin-like bacteriocin tRNase domain-containing protein [Klebsiella pneumoniae]